MTALTNWLLLTGGFAAGVVIVLLWPHTCAMEAEYEADKLLATTRRSPAPRAASSPHAPAWKAPSPSTYPIDYDFDHGGHYRRSDAELSTAYSSRFPSTDPRWPDEQRHYGPRPGNRSTDRTVYDALR